MSAYVQISTGENDEPMEIPCEEDGTLQMTSLSGLFPKACGLRYRNTDTGTMRGIRVLNEKLYPPLSENGEAIWGDQIYIAVFPKENKRKCIEENDCPPNKAVRSNHVDSNGRRTSDLIVLGLPWKTSEDGMKEYFGSFGDVAFVQVKRDRAGESKGFGFVRFEEFDSQRRCMRVDRHQIEGRWCNVRLPDSKDNLYRRDR